MQLRISNVQISPSAFSNTSRPTAKNESCNRLWNIYRGKFDLSTGFVGRVINYRPEHSSSTYCND